jgi:hypothetical protein
LSDAITYTETDGRVTIEMSLHDWEWLMVLLGYAMGAARDEKHWLFPPILDFVNRLNRTNPHFQPYEIPEKYGPRGKDG